ncbi:MAG TPA: hypothetical protein VFQ61_14095 [Polyangiaceae bacterium]|nr:hypothetical protein [Polyangiaceae bacterium]
MPALLAATTVALRVAQSEPEISAPSPPPTAQTASAQAIGIQASVSTLDFGLPPDFRAMRGVTLGPIESSLHPNRGYGSPAFTQAVSEVRRMGGSWISITPFGRVLNLKPTGVALTFEAPFAQNRDALLKATRQAHAAGLKVLMVPHLWVETGEWRGEIEPGDDAAWERWSRGYLEFVSAWAELAREAQVDLFAVGVELRSWLTTARAPSFQRVIEEVRRIYQGPLTYAANWDDVEETTILGSLDYIGINAFFPLAEQPNAPKAALLERGRAVAERVGQLAKAWQKPVIFTEFGYTTRPDPTLRPWEWPDSMKNVRVDQAAQAEAYEALLAPMIDQPWFAGAFVWRMYADPNDLSQEAEWGFSPRGKLAELTLRDAFAAHWASDGPRAVGASLASSGAERIGLY